MTTDDFANLLTVAQHRPCRCGPGAHPTGADTDGGAHRNPGGPAAVHAPSKRRGAHRRRRRFPAAGAPDAHGLRRRPARAAPDESRPAGPAARRLQPQRGRRRAGLGRARPAAEAPGHAAASGGEADADAAGTAGRGRAGCGHRPGTRTVAARVRGPGAVPEPDACDGRPRSPLARQHTHAGRGGGRTLAAVGAAAAPTSRHCPAG